MFKVASEGEGRMDGDAHEEGVSRPRVSIIQPPSTRAVNAHRGPRAPRHTPGVVAHEDSRQLARAMGAWKGGGGWGRRGLTPFAQLGSLPRAHRHATKGRQGQGSHLRTAIVGGGREGELRCEAQPEFVLTSSTSTIDAHG